jgi:hypothetical protein
MKMKWMVIVAVALATNPRSVRNVRGSRRYLHYHRGESGQGRRWAYCGLRDICGRGAQHRDEGHGEMLQPDYHGDNHPPGKA